MPVINGKKSNKTIMIMSFLSVAFLVSVILNMALGVFKPLLTPLGAGVIIIVAALMLILETYFEPVRDFYTTLKSTSGIINTLVSFVAFVYGFIVMFTDIAVTGMWSGIIIVSLIVLLIFLTKELLID